MTLLITVLAAVVCTAVWYKNAPKNQMMVGVLCWIYWGASLLWLVDAVFAYAQMGAAYFQPEFDELINNAFLGLSVVALGLVIWIVILLVRDPRGVVRDALLKKRTDASDDNIPKG